MRFTRDVSRDVVELEFTDCVLCTPESVGRWHRELIAGLSRWGHKVDLLINLDGLTVNPTASRSFGELRQRALERYTRVSFRYGGCRSTQTSIYTSAVIHRADANVYTGREEALAALFAWRLKNDVPDTRLAAKA